jgi:uncharacterized protein (UPF0210 family)
MEAIQTIVEALNVTNAAIKSMTLMQQRTLENLDAQLHTLENLQRTLENLGTQQRTIQIVGVISVAGLLMAIMW